MIAFKIYAAANPNRKDPENGRHYQDLLDLNPTSKEMDFALAWMRNWAETELLASANGVVRDLEAKHVT